MKNLMPFIPGLMVAVTGSVIVDATTLDTTGIMMMFSGILLFAVGGFYAD